MTYRAIIHVRKHRISLKHSNMTDNTLFITDSLRVFAPENGTTITLKFSDVVVAWYSTYIHVSICNMSSVLSRAHEF